MNVTLKSGAIRCRDLYHTPFAIDLFKYNLRNVRFSSFDSCKAIVLADTGNTCNGMLFEDGIRRHFFIKEGFNLFFDVCGFRAGHGSGFFESCGR